MRMVDVLTATLVVYQNMHCVCLYLEFPVLNYLFIWFNR